MQEVRQLSARPGEMPAGVPSRLMDALEKEYGKGQVPPKVLADLGFPGGTPARDPNFRLLGEHAPAPGRTGRVRAGNGNVAQAYRRHGV